MSNNFVQNIGQIQQNQKNSDQSNFASPYSNQNNSPSFSNSGAGSINFQPNIQPKTNYYSNNNQPQNFENTQQNKNSANFQPRQNPSFVNQSNPNFNQNNNSQPNFVGQNFNPSRPGQAIGLGQNPDSYRSISQSYSEQRQPSRFAEKGRFLHSSNKQPNNTEPVKIEDGFNIDQYQLEERQIMEQNAEEVLTEKYYTQILLISFAGIACYYLGACLVIFFQQADGQPTVILNSYPLTWQLFFEDTLQFLQNFFSTIFGYFIQYARLFGFFKDQGSLNTQVMPRYLLPVDIAIKAATIIYFNFFWMKSDTQRAVNLGVINEDYPFMQAKKKEGKEEEEETGGSIDGIITPGSKTNFIETDQIEAFANGSDDPHDYYLARKIQAKKAAEKTLNQKQNATLDDDDDDNDEEEEVGIIPFWGVQKPIEDFFFHNESRIYRIIRHGIIPGSNLVLVLYLSARGV